MDKTEKIDCTTCKYGYEDERLGIPMCHHPKRFSEDCVNFNVHEEKHLESKSNKTLEEEAEEWAENEAYGKSDAEFEMAYKGFIAGAKWQAEKDTRDMYMSDNRHLNKVYELGKKDMKEQMLKDAVEGEICGRVYDHINVRFADGVCKYLEPKNISHIPADVSKYNIGDKVRIIVLKAEEE